MVLRVSRGLLSPYLFIRVFLGPSDKGVAYQFTFLYLNNNSSLRTERSTVTNTIMKAILRKGAVACAAMLMGANVMAQGLENVATVAECSSVGYIEAIFTYDQESQILFHSEEGVTIFNSEFKELKTLGESNLIKVIFYSGYYNPALAYTQTLFNNDEQYEYLSYSDSDWEKGIYKNVQIVNESGECLYKFDRDFSMYSDVFLMLIRNRSYLIVTCYNENNEEVRCVYEINKETNSINFVRETRTAMNIAPTLAERDAQITITLNDTNGNVARELVITGVNGQLVERRDIPAGENSVQIPASMLRSGMYNFTLQQKGQVVDNGKVIVK